MLFPRARDGRPRTAIAADRRRATRSPWCRGWAGDRRGRRPRRDVPRGRQRAGHAAARRARPRPVHPPAPARPPGRPAAAWTTWFRVVDQEVDDDPARASRAEDPHAGLGLVYELEAVAGGALRGRGHGDQHRRRATTSCTGLEVVLPLADDHVELLDFTGRHERERSPSGTRSTDGLWLREGLRRPPRPRRRDHGRRRHARLLHHRTAGWSACTSPGAATPCCASSATPRTAPRSAAASTCCPARSCCRPGRRTRSPWVFFAAADDGLDGLAARWHAYQRSLDAHPDVQPVVLNVWEAVFFDHDLDRLQGDRRPGRPGRASSGSCSTTAGSTTGATTPPGSATGVVDETVWPDGLDPLDRPRAGARHGVRAVVRARDGQPRLRPLPRAPRLDPVGGGGREPLHAPQPAGARPDPARGRRPPLRAGARRPVGARRSTT